MEPRSCKVSRCLMLFISVFLHEIVAYDFKCPENRDWQLRAEQRCNNTEIYFCLYNNVYEYYVEGCAGPHTEKKGRKSIYAGSFQRERCNKDRYQPFNFVTTEGSKCAFEKFLCNELGQMVSSNGSLLDDRRCQCDIDYGFVHLSEINDHMNCNPTIEDCSCYKRNHSKATTGITDYNFETTSNEWRTIQLSSPGLPADNARTADISEFWKEGSRHSNKSRAIVAVLILFLMVIGVFVPIFIATDRIHISKTLVNVFYEPEDDETSEDFEEEVSFKHKGIFSMEELNYLFLVHVVFRVACPVVKIKFKYELPDETLRQQLKVRKNILKKRLGNKLCQDQRRLLWPDQKENTEVSSVSFDIRLMICLLNELTELNIVDRLPLESDRSVNEMLARIKYMRNFVTLAVDGTLNDKDFIQHWKYTFQALYQLLTPRLKGIEVDTLMNNAQLVGRLERHLNLDNYSLKTFNWWTFDFIGHVLRKIITEMCTSRKKTISDLLNDEMHSLCHKRIKQFQCCECAISFFYHEIADKQWKKLYDRVDNAQCTSCRNKKDCSKRFKVKPDLNIDNFDCSLLKCLVLNMPCVARYMFSSLYKETFSSLMKKYKHDFLHAFRSTKCCKCKNDPTETTVGFTVRDWNFLFVKKQCQDFRTCFHFDCSDYTCCCHFKPNDEIKIDDIDDDLLHKIMRLVKPFNVLKETERVIIDNYYEFMYPDNTLKTAALEILKVVKDVQFKTRMTSMANTESNDPIHQRYALEWANSHADGRKSCDSTYDGLTVIYRKLYEKDSMKMKIKYVKSNRFSEIEAFTDLTSEEVNFLLVFYLLQQVVCPAVRTEFDKQSRNHPTVLKKVLKDMHSHEHNKPTNDEQTIQGVDNKKEANTRHFYLSQIHRSRLFPDNDVKDMSKDFDLKLMILILERLKIHAEIPDSVRDVYGHVKKINTIRKRVMQNGSGTISQPDFDDIWDVLHMAVISLAGDRYDEKFKNLKEITNVFAYTRKHV